MTINVRLSSQRRERTSSEWLNTFAAGAPVHWLDVTPVESRDVPCTIRSLDVLAQVSGLFVQVTQTLVVRNPNHRPMSASFAIPLPDRAVVCGYALDIDDQMIEGVVVEQEKARVTFEAEQRRGADPGLVEAVRGNVYRTRVYPIMPGRTRRVMLRYVAPLMLTGSHAVLDLPMPAEHLNKRSLRVEVEMLDCPKPIVLGLGDIPFNDAQGQWIIEHEDLNITSGSPVRIALPQLPSSFARLERDGEGTLWFTASQEVAEATEEPEPRTFTSLTVLWDASGSHNVNTRSREMGWLHDLCYESSFESFRLVVFGDRVRMVEEFDSISDLLSELMMVPYDGGTNLAELARAVADLSQTDDEGAAYVLVTDGFDTLSGKPFELPADINILAVLSGTERDAETLRQACHGLVFDFDQAPKDADGFARALSLSNPNRLASVQGTGIADVCDASVPGVRHIVIGRLLGEQTTISLDGGKTSLVLDAADSREGATIARAWAARRVALLSPRANDFGDELLALGRRFGVVSPATSLLVLESLDQWLRHDIEPPESWKRMHDQWVRAKASEMRTSSEQRRKDMHRRALADDWSELLRWWECDYSEQRARLYAANSGGFCHHCGAQLIPGLPFCPDCGHRLSSVHAAEGAPDAERTEVIEVLAASSESPWDSFVEEDSSMADYVLEESSPRASEPRLMRAHAVESAPEPRAASESSDMLRRSIFSAPEEEESRTNPVRVSIGLWSPDAPYLKHLDMALDVGIDKARQQYLSERQRRANSPAFFLDCTNWFIAHDSEDFGLQVLSNLAELRIEDAALLRVMAWRLREAGRLEQALVTLRRVQHLRSEDAQSYRDMALVLSELARSAFEQGDEDAARSYATEAGELYRKLALTPWDRRPMAISLFAVEEYNVLRAWAQAQNWKHAPELPSLGTDLEGVLACDLRITLAWDADETDVDIHVTEPSGEEAYYANRHTYCGGRVSEDITDGYGPELYEIRRAEEGVYSIRAHYFASHQQSVFGPATCTLTVYTDWGRPGQTQQITSVRLDKERAMVPVGTASYGNAALEEPESTQESQGQLREQPVILPGMTVDEVREILGEPSDILLDDGRRYLKYAWTQEGGRTLAVHFTDGRVSRVLEQMPWGEETILAQ